jgi:hypothetical protein
LRRLLRIFAIKAGRTDVFQLFAFVANNYDRRISRAARRPVAIAP